ncbi:hypothetical protein OOZ51_01130 [Arthrobacter sp. MI7-26]|uniref:hypothetical protein n=1 Tax=Arthrobacter sp. MI7-26 TaxID=2993653 RepID=UPI002248A0DF|nr:hypothetical protein [Arthrobacter sp. MI7-26]MCX2746416.1 hypothetical protein [Arthrobacter sp. MI7-26]
MVPAAIKSKGTLTIGSDTTYAPAEFLGTDCQTPVGYDVDIEIGFAREVGDTLTFMNTRRRTNALSSLEFQPRQGISVSPVRSDVAS